MRRTVVAVLSCSVVLLAGCQDDASVSEADPSASATSTVEPSTGTTAATSTPEPSPASPAELGFDPAVLDRLAERAEDAGSTCFLVARHGRLAGEWYWNGGAPDKPQEVFSVTKSVTSTLVGIAQADGD